MALLSRLIQCSLTAGLLLVSGASYAESGRVDYDLDDDGLIEINDLADLDEIRNNLDGTSLYGVSTGCPIEGCTGFELTTDLDFDTNQNGVIDAQDTYWNEGEGWLPLGASSDALTAAIKGNGHTIAGLMINRPSTYNIGLIGSLTGSTVEEVLLINVAVIGGSNVGGLVGSVSDTQITDVYVQGGIKGEFHSGYTGGVAGNASSGSYCQGCAVAGLVEGDRTGGIFGYSGTVENSLSLAAVRSSNNAVSGVVGFFPNFIKNTLVLGLQLHNDAVLAGNANLATAEQSYWAVDTTGLTYSGFSGPNQTDVAGVLLSELQCPTSANNTSCASVELFKQWDLAINTRGEAYWDFGTSEQAPGLRIAGKLIRDSDGDGIPDLYDDFPNQIAASKDTDKDGAIDAWSLVCDQVCRESSGWVLDQFIDNSAASIDLDLDGLPDQWNNDCDSTCQSSSGLTLDAHLDDFDNDGVVSALDTDDNGDGIEDADADGDGYIDVATLTELDAIRFSLDGRGQRLTQGGELDISGCRSLSDGQWLNECLGYELVADLDFDTSQNGVIDAQDAYWNEGQGWLPLGTYNDALTAPVKGNGHTIDSLMVNRPSTEFIGLIGSMTGSTVEEVLLINVAVIGRANVGGLVGRVSDTQITDVYVQGVIKGKSQFGPTGGIAGSASGDSGCQGCAVAGLVEGEFHTGGIFAAGGTVENSLSLAAVRSSSQFVSGVVGFGSDLVKNTLVLGPQLHTQAVLAGHAYGTAEQSYWAVDSTGLANSGFFNFDQTDVAGVLLSELQCPTSANNTSCADVTLYNNWGLALNGRGEMYWDFGTSEQAPGLKIAGQIIRDSDGDGVLDDFDHFPGQYEISVDSDSDGYADKLNEYCDDTCQLESALVIDQLPNNPHEWLDTDSDGIGNNADTDDDNDGVLDGSDAFPLDAAESLDTDSDGIGNNTDTDDDNDGVADGADAFPLNPSESLDTDNDGIGNNTDTDDDNDGVIDGADVFPLDAGETVDTDNDGIGNNADTDDDNDGVADGADAFPLNPSETLDTDNDGIGNNTDTDDDNDGVLDGADVFPLDASETVDTDNDGIGNNADTDDDNDGVVDGADAFPLNSSESLDTDSDGIGNNTDTDDDNDGVADGADAYPLIHVAVAVDPDRDGLPNTCDSACLALGMVADTDDDNDGVIDTQDDLSLDPSESVDTDRDGIGNNADTDDDNDGVADGADVFPLDALESIDTDNDGIGNNADTDDDNDGVLDVHDDFPLDASRSLDTDKDGIDNLVDTDDDNDSVLDVDDAFPLDANESVDTDRDGIGNNADSDDDNDGVNDGSDAFPLDALESVDSDLDGIGNNADTDDDNDGVEDYLDALPLDASESVDTDNDGIGNNADTDDDNDGVLDVEDAFPLNANESVDSDGDGFGNNEDVDDDNDMITDVWEQSYGFDPLDANDALLDADNDGASNLDEFESGTDPRDADSVPAWLRGGGAWKYYLYKKAAEGATLQ